MELKIIEVDVLKIVEHGITNLLSFAMDMASDEDTPEAIASARMTTNDLYEILENPKNKFELLQKILSDGFGPMAIPEIMEELEDLTDKGIQFCLHVVKGDTHIGIIDGDSVSW